MGHEIGGLFPPASSAMLPGFSRGIREQAAFSVPLHWGALEGVAAALTAELQNALLGLGAECGPAASSLASGTEILSWAPWGAKQELQAELPGVTGGLPSLHPRPAPLSTGKSRLFRKQGVFQGLCLKGCSVASQLLYVVEKVFPCLLPILDFCFCEVAAWEKGGHP